MTAYPPQIDLNVQKLEPDPSNPDFQRAQRIILSGNSLTDPPWSFCIDFVPDGTGPNSTSLDNQTVMVSMKECQRQSVLSLLSNISQGNVHGICYPNAQPGPWADIEATFEIQAPKESLKNRKLRSADLQTIDLDARSYTVYVYAGGDGPALGYMKFAGDAPGWQFAIQFCPDGTPSTPPGLDIKDSVVVMTEEWSQFGVRQDKLSTCRAIKCRYNGSAADDPSAIIEIIGPSIVKRAKQTKSTKSMKLAKST